jgi:hypothetical protein
MLVTCRECGGYAECKESPESVAISRVHFGFKRKPKNDLDDPMRKVYMQCFRPHNEIIICEEK